MKHIRAIGKERIPQVALTRLVKVPGEDKKPPINATMTL